MLMDSIDAGRPTGGREHIMTITSKYPGRCTVCGTSISVGEQIEWTKGAGARHAKCGDAKAPARRARREPIALAPGHGTRRAAKRAPAAGEQQIYRDSSPYDVGDVVRLRGSEAWLTVTTCGSYRITQFEDDTREGDRRYWAYARPATEAEAATATQQRADHETAKQAATTALKSIETGEGQGRGWMAPAGCDRIAAEPQRGSLASKPYLLASPDGVVYYVRPVYDDDSVVIKLALTVDAARDAAKLAGWEVR